MTFLHIEKSLYILYKYIHSASFITFCLYGGVLKDAGCITMKDYSTWMHERLTISKKNERTKVAWKTFFWDSTKDLGNCCTIQKGLIHSTFFITRCTHYSHTLPNYVDSICQKENEAVTFCVRQLFVSLFLKFVIHQNHSEKNDPNVWGRLYKAAYH